jgi:hypothetical protein
MVPEKTNQRRRTNAPIFIVGLPRSGSTLWSNMIAKHPDVAIFAEMHFLNPWHKDFRYLLRRVGDLSDEKNVRRLVDRIFLEPPARGLRRGPYFWRSIRKLKDTGLADALTQQILASEKRDIGFIFRTLIEEATRCRDKNRAAVKFPVYPAYIDRLIDWWPEARLIHIARDPRSLAASKSNDPGGTARLIQRYRWTKPILPLVGMAFATIQYIWASHAHTRMTGQPNYRLFLYEDLLGEPEKTIREVCDFCELDFAESMLNPAAGQASSVSGLTASGFDATRMRGWEKQLSPWQSRLIKFVTKPSMRRFGYEPDRPDAHGLR